MKLYTRGWVGIARRYDVHKRTAQRMGEDGRVPPPDFYNGPSPTWDNDRLDEHDRAAAVRKTLKPSVAEDKAATTTT